MTPEEARARKSVYLIARRSIERSIDSIRFDIDRDESKLHSMKKKNCEINDISIQQSRVDRHINEVRRYNELIKTVDTMIEELPKWKISSDIG